MDPKTILPDFQQFLSSRKLAPEKNISYLANWASKFLAFCNRTGHADIEHTVTAFLNSLETREDLKDWQIRQAEEAVRLYLNHFKGDETLSVKNTQRLKGCLSNKQKVLSEMKKLIRLKHFAYNTELVYLDWAGRFFQYVGATMPVSPEDDIPTEAVQNFLSHLAMTRRVASSTQNQALCALVFLFREVLGRDLSDISGIVWAKRGEKLPVVLSVEETKALFKHLSGTAQLIAQLIYGAGLRIMELARLRVLDVDFEGNLLIVRSGKGDKDRSTLLPEAVKGPLRLHLQKVKTLHDKDLSSGFGEVYLPAALERKYTKAAKEWKWQYVFPSANLSVDPRSGKVRRHHVSDKGIQLAIGKAVKKAGIMKHATVHTLRHSFATHLLMKGVNIREIQELLGHKNVETTMIYTHVLRDLQGVPQSPLDALMKEEP